MLALDPPGNPTIGACVAANLSGPRRHRYGTARDLVIGVTVVLADGTIASSGGKVVKNVAGYDLGKLFCGSEGRLGLIARVALRLHPRPEVGADAGGAGRVGRGRGREGAGDPARAARAVGGGRRSGRAGWRCCSRAAARGGRAVRRTRRRSSAAPRTSARSGRRRRRGRRRSQGRLLFSPGELAQTLAGLDEAVVRVSAGRRLRAAARSTTRATRARSRSPSACARSSTRRGCWCDRDLEGADRRLRPLRVLPADVPDVRAALAGGDGLAARADLPDGRARRRDDRR